MFMKGLLILLFVFPFASYAEDADDSGWYAGVLFGNVSTRTEEIGVFVQDESTNSYGIYGGRDFTSWFGLEAGAVKTGDVSNNRMHVVSADYFYTTVTPKFTLKLNQTFSLYGKLGLAIIDYEEGRTDSLFSGNSYDRTWRAREPVFAVGATARLAHGIHLRINYESMTGRLRKLASLWPNFTPIINLDTELKQLSLGLHYQF